MSSIWDLIKEGKGKLHKKENHTLDIDVCDSALLVIS